VIHRPGPGQILPDFQIKPLASSAASASVSLDSCSASSRPARFVPAPSPGRGGDRRASACGATFSVKFSGDQWTVSTCRERSSSVSSALPVRWASSRFLEVSVSWATPAPPLTSGTLVMPFYVAARAPSTAGEGAQATATGSLAVSERPGPAVRVRRLGLGGAWRKGYLVRSSSGRETAARLRSVVEGCGARLATGPLAADRWQASPSRTGSSSRRSRAGSPAGVLP
jgi:hypothetical protein